MTKSSPLQMRHGICRPHRAIARRNAAGANNKLTEGIRQSDLCWGSRIAFLPVRAPIAVAEHQKPPHVVSWSADCGCQSWENGLDGWVRVGVFCEAAGQEVASFQLLSKKAVRQPQSAHELAKLPSSYRNRRVN